jgi:hypothetical protein
MTRHESRAESPAAETAQVPRLRRPESVTIRWPLDDAQPPTAEITIARYVDGELVHRSTIVRTLPPAMARQLEARAILAMNEPDPAPEGP